MGMAGGGSDADQGGIEIEDQTVTGAYTITTVSAASPQPLRAWISDRSFSLAKEADPILQWYIDKKWHFLAIQIDLDNAQSEGGLKPLKLAFPTGEPVFPLRISAITTTGPESEDDYLEPTEILLYLVADERLQARNRQTTEEFSHSYTRGDLEDFPMLRKYLPAKGVLSKARFWADAKEMTDDVFFASAKGDSAPARPRAAAIPLDRIFLVVLLGCAALRLRPRRRQ
jgi:hypothetical protein